MYEVKQFFLPQLFLIPNILPCQPQGPWHISYGAEFLSAEESSRAVPSVSLRPLVAVISICLLCPSLQDFVSGLSTILRGTIDDRLNWAFNLYDLNKDGCITREVGWRVRTGPQGQHKSAPGRDQGRIQGYCQSSGGELGGSVFNCAQLCKCPP